MEIAIWTAVGVVALVLIALAVAAALMDDADYSAFDD